MSASPALWRLPRARHFRSVSVLLPIPHVLCTSLRLCTYRDLLGFTPILDLKGYRHVSYIDHAQPVIASPLFSDSLAVPQIMTFEFSSTSGKILRILATIISQYYICAFPSYTTIRVVCPFIHHATGTHEKRNMQALRHAFPYQLACWYALRYYISPQTGTAASLSL
jgi:hypothetical protein